MWHGGPPSTWLRLEAVNYRKVPLLGMGISGEKSWGGACVGAKYLRHCGLPGLPPCICSTPLFPALILVVLCRGRRYSSNRAARARLIFAHRCEETRGEGGELARGPKTASTRASQAVGILSHVAVQEEVGREVNDVVGLLFIFLLFSCSHHAWVVVSRQTPGTAVVRVSCFAIFFRRISHGKQAAQVQYLCSRAGVAWRVARTLVASERQGLLLAQQFCYFRVVVSVTRVGGGRKWKSHVCYSMFLWPFATAVKYICTVSKATIKAAFFCEL